jgi:hypothetical protein
MGGGGKVPSRLVEQEYGVAARRDGGGDLCQVKVHRRGVSSGHDERRTFAQRGADGTEDVGGSGALIGGRGWAGSTPGPATRDRVLLTDPGFVGEPDLYLGRLDILVLGDFCQNSRGKFYGMAHRVR